MGEAAFNTPDDPQHPAGRAFNGRPRKGGANPGGKVITVRPTHSIGRVGRDTRGAPSKFTEERANSIIRLLSDGNFVTTTCRSNNISEDTFTNWVKKGELLDEELGGYDDREAAKRCVTEEDARFLIFSRNVNRALHETEHEALATLRNAFGQDWRSADVYLRVRYPDRYSLNRVAVSVSTQLSTSEMQRMIDVVCGVLRKYVDVGLVEEAIGEVAGQLMSG